MNDRTPIQYAAGSLAASAFIAVTQLLAAPTLDLPLYIALFAFATNIPFQIVLFFMSLENVERIDQARRLRTGSQSLSWTARLYSSISLISPPAILIGFVAMFWHFAWWLGILLGLAACAAFSIFHYFANED
jgi:hypothetical protein